MFDKVLSVQSADLIAPLVEPSMKLAQVKKEIGDNPGDFENYRRYMEAAALYFQMKEYERALEELKSASALRPGLAEPHLCMGDCYAKMGRKDDAMKSYRRALELNPAEERARMAVEDMRLK